MKRVSPTLRVFVGREDHGASSYVAVVRDVVEDVRCVAAVRQVADLVDDEYVGSKVVGQSLLHDAVATRR